MRKLLRNLSLLSALCLFAASVMTAQSVADLAPLNFMVVGNGDSADASPGDGLCADRFGLCTLRAAIEEANATTVQDSIAFASDFSPTITLTLGPLQVTNPLTITGPGARNLTIERTAAPNASIFGVFNITAPATLRGFTIKGGSSVSGGGVRASAPIVLSELALIGNTATAGAAVFLSDSASYQLSTIERCLISGNRATGQGGAVYVSVGPTVAINSSTVTGNQALFGGAIVNNGWTILVNNTIVRNTAPSASSMANMAGGKVELFNNVIGLDASSPGGAVAGTFSSFGNNFVTNSAGSGGWIDSDILNSNKDPLLGPLADNGGPTDSIAPLPASPLINRGNNCPPMLPVPGCVFVAEYSAFFDQRGFTRRVGTVDIGAVEFGAGPVRGRF